MLKTLSVEMTFSSTGYNINIRDVYQINNKLIGIIGVSTNDLHGDDAISTLRAYASVETSLEHPDVIWYGLCQDSHRWYQDSIKKIRSLDEIIELRDHTPLSISKRAVHSVHEPEDRIPDGVDPGVFLVEREGREAERIELYLRMFGIEKEQALTTERGLDADVDTRDDSSRRSKP